MRNAKTAAQRAYLTRLQKDGPGPRTDPCYKFRFQVLCDADYLDALGRDDLVGSRNALTAIVVRVYRGEDVPELVLAALRAAGAKVPE